MRKVLSWSDYEIFAWSSSEDDSSRGAESPGAVVELRAEDLDRIERARPGYARQALAYLRQGNRVLAGMEGGTIVAMAWFYVNQTSRQVRVKGFPLAPSESYFHADWTAAESRGRGWHRSLIAARIDRVQDAVPDGRVYACISPENSTSIRSYSRSGFDRVGRVAIGQFWRYTLGGRVRKES